MNKEHDLARVELLQAQDLARYLVHDEREIFLLLRHLLDGRSLINAHSATTNDAFLTALLAVQPDPPRLMVDVSPDAALNERLLQAGALDCHTQLDKVRIQFRVDVLGTDHWKDSPAFSTALPHQLLRLQRRELYRLQTPMTHPLNCSLPLPDGKQLKLRIIDISGGGVAIAVPPSEHSLAPGDEFPGCCIELPNKLLIVARLIVRNLFRLTTHQGVEMLRAGCELAELPPGADEAIQRYILQTERTRNAHRHA